MGALLHPSTVPGPASVPSGQTGPVWRGPAEFLRCATAVIEPGIGARSASQAALVEFGLS